MYSTFASMFPGFSKGRWVNNREITLSLDSCCHWLMIPGLLASPSRMCSSVQSARECSRQSCRKRAWVRLTRLSRESSATVCSHSFQPLNQPASTPTWSRNIMVRGAGGRGEIKGGASGPPAPSSDLGAGLGGGKISAAERGWAGGGGLRGFWRGFFFFSHLLLAGALWWGSARPREGWAVRGGRPGPAGPFAGEVGGTVRGQERQEAGRGLEARPQGPGGRRRRPLTTAGTRCGGVCEAAPSRPCRLRDRHDPAPPPPAPLLRRLFKWHCDRSGALPNSELRTP